MAKNKFHILGQVIDRSTNLGIPGRKIEAWDKDVKYSDLLGVEKTDSTGKFEIKFDDSYYADALKDKLPDLFFKVFDGEKLILSTEDDYIKNLKPGKFKVTLEEGIEMVATPRTDLTGLRIQLWGNPGIFVIDAGLKRLIPSMEVYNKLFKSVNGIIEDLNIDLIPTGSPIPIDAELVRFVDTGNTTYFLDGNTPNRIKRVIPGEAFDRYHFDMEKIKNYDGKSNDYADGTPIEMPDWWYIAYPG